MKRIEVKSINLKEGGIIELHTSDSNLFNLAKEIDEKILMDCLNFDLQTLEKWNSCDDEPFSMLRYRNEVLYLSWNELKEFIESKRDNG